MKILLSILVVLFLSLSTFAQSLFVQGRPVGYNTFILVPVTGSTGYSPTTGQPLSISGFQMKVGSTGQVFFWPFDFYMGSVFYQNNWAYPQTSIFNNILNIATVGNPIYLNNDEIGTLQLHVNASDPGTYAPPNISFFDGVKNWVIGSTSFNVINLPQERYTDNNNDGVINITDAEIEWSMLGTATFMNDTARVIADPDGDGQITTGDVNLILQKIVNPTTVYPIFSNYGYGRGVAITMSWKKLTSGKWGLFSNEKITNGDLVGNGQLQSVGNGWFKNVGNKTYFINKDVSMSDPILIADNPVALTGTVNGGRKIIISSTTGISEKSQNLKEFSLIQNFPNPFNPSTMISYQIPTSGLVTLKVYDILGKEVATLVNEEKNAGMYEVKFDASKLSSGMYICRLNAGNNIQTKKMILMK